MKFTDIPAWINAHPLEVAMWAYVALGGAVGAMPESWRKRPYIGYLVRLLELLSPLAHKNSQGTLKLPFTTAVKDPEPPGPSRPSIVPPMVLLLLACAQCGPKLPPVENCTRGAFRCHNDQPEVCSATGRWHAVGDITCGTVGAACSVSDAGVAYCAVRDGGL